MIPLQRSWTIKARVISKTRILHGGRGPFIAIDLLDGSGEIRAVAFARECNKFFKYFETFKVNSVYYLSNLIVQDAYPSPINNRYELMLIDESVVILCEETPHITYNFKPIKSVQGEIEGSFADVIGVCTNTEQDGETDEKGVIEKSRNIELMDESNNRVTVHLRGPEAVNFDGSLYPIVAIKNGYVTYFKNWDLNILERQLLVDSYRINPEPTSILRELFEQNKGWIVNY